ncbi:MAG: hypothetical protein JNM21_15420 [Taibaiella sp.]|nr:hypothetical protein [Taibaiella sp.]
MKKAILLFLSGIIVAASFTSCDKKYTCVCKIQNADGSLEDPDAINPVGRSPFKSKTRKEADAHCATMNKTWTNANGESVVYVCFAD